MVSSVSLSAQSKIASEIVAPDEVVLFVWHHHHHRVLIFFIIIFIVVVVVVVIVIIISHHKSSYLTSHHSQIVLKHQSCLQVGKVFTLQMLFYYAASLIQTYGLSQVYMKTLDGPFPQMAWLLLAAICLVASAPWFIGHWAYLREKRLRSDSANGAKQISFS